ncbi:hypothetical protein [Acetobacter sp. AAB5]|uniref:hypothetical protein n=1 Tax=Acetobacter sp. AAB5 TaxID=3418370 RepID=UPI003CF71EE9
MLGSDRICRTDVEEASLDRLAEKQDWFSQPDRPLLRVIWLDMMAHPDWMAAICTEAIEAAVAQMACGRKKFTEVKERMPGRNFRQEKRRFLPASRWRARE